MECSVDTCNSRTWILNTTRGANQVEPASARSKRACWPAPEGRAITHRRELPRGREGWHTGPCFLAQVVTVCRGLGLDIVSVGRARVHFVHRFLGEECLIDLVQLNGAVIALSSTTPFASSSSPFSLLSPVLPSAHQLHLPGCGGQIP